MNNSKHKIINKDTYYISIQNFLKRFENTVLSPEDYQTTVNDILWNINQLLKRI